jgi:hypothetical protein
VASNVRGREGVRANETVVLVGSAPGDTLRDTGANHGAGEAFVLLAIDLDADNAAVSISRSGEGAQEGGGLEERHVVCFVG